MKEIRLLKAQNLNISKEYGAYTVWDFDEGNEGFSAVGNSELKQGKGSVIFSAEDKMLICNRRVDFPFLLRL